MEAVCHNEAGLDRSRTSTTLSELGEDRFRGPKGVRACHAAGRSGAAARNVSASRPRGGGVPERGVIDGRVEQVCEAGSASQLPDVHNVLVLHGRRGRET